VNTDTSSEAGSAEKGNGRQDGRAGRFEGFEQLEWFEWFE
jgi:hypothetical protein